MAGIHALGRRDHRNAFSLEGFAFFTEAIFLGIYLYGWERAPPQAHLTAGLVVALSRAGSLKGTRPARGLNRGALE
jgi:hypothetical protein